MAADLNHELCAVLIFENSKAIESLRIRHNAEASAIGKFVGYKDIPMQRGDTKHLPIFSCVGLKVWDTGFVNTEGTQPKQTSEPGELKQGPVGATDVGPSIKKAQTTQTTDSDSDEGSGRTTTYIILIGAFAIGYFAVKKMRARTLSRASTIAAILGGIVFSIILTVAIDKFQRGEWSLRGSGPISSVNVVSHQHAMKNAHYVPGKVQVTWNVRLKNEASQPISHITVKYSWLGKNDEELAWGTNGVTNLEGGESITVGGERIMEEQLYRQVAKVRVKMSTREQETKTNTFAVTTEDDSTEGHLKGGRPPK